MGVHSTDQLLIIGGGLMGLSVAHSLAKKGKKVIIFSRRRNEAAGFVAAGMLAPHAEGLTGQMLKLGKLSLQLQSNWVATIEKDSGLDCGLRNCGIVVPFRNFAERDKYPTAQYGELLDRNALLKEAPGLHPQWKSGIIFHQDGQIDNRRLLMRALEKACFELGVQFQEGVKVLKLINSSKGFEGVQIQNAEGKIKSIHSKEGVLCSGAWAKELLTDLPIFPVKGQMLSIQGPRNALKRVIFGPGTYLVPRQDGLIIVGATSEKNAGFDEGLTPIGQTQLQEGISSLLPKASNWPHMERWWGFRPCTPDQKPILGVSSIKGLWLATGHYRNGVLLSAITSYLLQKIICNENLNTEEKEILKTFKWDRFQ
ncbi:glycine oxidase ThiO [Prochlorococcus sp. MIT 1223]|uniref:glycine oxidase ThiO n=1 Tax=Prochlorococcus sp. MIT 1223 TaxID=3096217 RepID=UPI002A758217|nr:glycine oxidase ThiO [Prochlorococcus sp. MIT 1223]